MRFRPRRLSLSGFTASSPKLGSWKPSTTDRALAFGRPPLSSLQVGTRCGLFSSAAAGVTACAGLATTSSARQLCGSTERSAGQALDAASAGSVVLLDGGMGHQLRATGVEISGPVGSMRRFLGVAMANLDQPELVRDAHLAYIDTGADVITSNSYSCVPRCLHAPDSPASAVDLDAIIRRAGELAREACGLRPGRKVRVAGCLPPLAESYRPDRVGDFADNVEQYRRIAAAIAPLSDLLLCETMSTIDEARAAFTAAAETGLPVWVALTLKEHRPVLRSGEAVEAAVAALREVFGARGTLEAVLFNCTSPEIIAEAMPLLRASAPEGVLIGGYANGFITASSGTGEYRDLSPEEYSAFARSWIKGGASVVGGCCGIFPRHIQAIHQDLTAKRV